MSRSKRTYGHCNLGGQCWETVAAGTQQESQRLNNLSCVLFFACHLALMTSKCAQRDLDSAQFLDRTLVFVIFAVHHPATGAQCLAISETMNGCLSAFKSLTKVKLSSAVKVDSAHWVHSEIQN